MAKYPGEDVDIHYKMDFGEKIKVIENIHASNNKKATDLLNDLQQRAVSNQNIFEALMEVCKRCTLGQITNSLFEVGGQYRRNM